MNRSLIRLPDLTLVVLLAAVAARGDGPPATAPNPGPVQAPAKGAAAGVEILRATVQLRNGEHRGSGTVIASRPDDTWILTAAHVVAGASNLQVELHRHNLTRTAPGLTEGGGWPRLIRANVVAADPATDLALLRLRGMVALPYVARVDLEGKPPAKGDVLTSVGIDRGLHLTRWTTAVEGLGEVDIKQGGDGPRLFTITAKFPEHGRSGGGLFRPDGTLVGVCTGQLSIRPGLPKVGVFAALPHIQALLREQGVAARVRSGPRP